MDKAKEWVIVRIRIVRYDASENLRCGCNRKNGGDVL